MDNPEPSLTTQEGATTRVNGKTLEVQPSGAINISLNGNGDYLDPLPTE